MSEFTILSVNICDKKGEKKTPVDRVDLQEDHGIEGDAHAGPGIRQVSLLAQEDIDTLKNRGLTLNPGDFAENITTKGIDLSALPLGTRLDISGCLLEVTQIGKECHDKCAIFEQVGDCVMPRKGIFVRVLKGGSVSPGAPGRVAA